MTIKLLIADVDGTLVTREKVVTARARAAVARLREAGILFTVTSGRPPRGLAGVVSELKLTTAVAAFNGGVYVQPDLTTVLSRRTLSCSAAHEVLGFLLNAGLDVWIYQGCDWWLRRPDAPHVARESRNVGFAPRVACDLRSILDEPIKIVGVSDDLAQVERCEVDLAARLGADAAVVRSQPFYLEVTHPEANKGMVVRESARILNIPLEQIAAIGDMPNDVPMLRVAGLSIAMGNAAPEVRRVARHVTASNDDEGFARGIEDFILGEPPLARTPLGLPPRARGLLFGLDGVLTQTAPVRAAAWKQLFDEYLRCRAREAEQPFVPFDPMEDLRRYFQAREPEAGIRALLESRGIELPDPTVRALARRYDDLLGDRLQVEQVETYEGSLRYLRAAREAGLRTAVVAPRDDCADVLRAAGIADLFDLWVDQADVVARRLATRPAPDAHLAAARALGLDSEETVVFETGADGVEAGRAGHFAYVVGIDRAGRGGELRCHGADVVVPDLGSLLEYRPSGSF
jgi:Cof subfamily protein (haloacid dehalogenase superfamily)